MKKFFPYFLALCLAFGTSCSSTDDTTPTYDEDLVENVTFTNTVNIVFQESQVSIESTASAEDIQIENLPEEVKIHSHIDNVEYHVSGQATGKALRIYSLNKYKLVLQNLTLNSGKQPAINLQSTKRCFLEIQGENYLTDTFGYPTNNNPGPLEGEATPDGEDKKGAFFTEGQVIVTGTGSLTIAGNNKHAFATDEYLRVRSGELHVNHALSCGIRAKEYVWIENGNVKLDSIVNKAIKIGQGYFSIGGGTLDITTLNDGIYAAYGSPGENEPVEPMPVCDVIFHGGSTTIKLLKGQAGGKPEKAYAASSYQGNILLQGGDIKIIKHPNAISFKGNVVEGNAVVTIEDTFLQNNP